MASPTVVSVSGNKTVEWIGAGGMNRGYRLFHFSHESELFLSILAQSVEVGDRLHDVAIQTSIPLGTLAFSYKRGGFPEVCHYLDKHCVQTMDALAALQAEGRG